MVLPDHDLDAAFPVLSFRGDGLRHGDQRRRWLGEQPTSGLRQPASSAVPQMCPHCMSPYPQGLLGPCVRRAQGQREHWAGEEANSQAAHSALSSSLCFPSQEQTAQPGTGSEGESDPLQHLIPLHYGDGKAWERSWRGPPWSPQLTYKYKYFSSSQESFANTRGVSTGPSSEDAV